MPDGPSFEGARFYGTLVHLDDSRGFGWVRLGGWPRRKDIFVHVSHIVGDILPAVGDPLEFSIEERQKGPMAVNVVRLPRPRVTMTVPGLPTGDAA